MSHTYHTIPITIAQLTKSEYQFYSKCELSDDLILKLERPAHPKISTYKYQYTQPISTLYKSEKQSLLGLCTQKMMFPPSPSCQTITFQF